MWGNRFRILLVSISLAFYGLAAGLSPRLLQQTELPTGWYPQLVALVSISAAASCALYYIPRLAAVLLLLAVKIVILAIVLYPWYGIVAFALCMSIPLVLELGLLVRPPFGAGLALTSMLFVELSPHVFTPWRGHIVTPEPMHQATVLVAVAVVAVLAGMLRTRTDRSRRLKDEINRLEQDILRLTTANIGFQQYADLVQEESSANERRRISREIHDTVGYTLTNVLAMIEACKDLAVQGNMEEQMQWLERVKRQAQEGFEETRRALRELRATEADLPAGLHLVQRVVATFREVTKVNVEVEYGNMPLSAGKEVDEVIYHLVQEALTNAIRHGRATQVWIRFWLDDAGIKISIRDNGKGSDEIEEGGGLRGMRERIEALGGGIRPRSVPPGFHLYAWIPAPRAKG